MADHRKPHDYPYTVCMVGETQPNRGILGFDNEADAKANADDRNQRAIAAKLQARYEVWTH